MHYSGTTVIIHFVAPSSSNHSYGSELSDIYAQIRLNVHYMQVTLVNLMLKYGIIGKNEKPVYFIAYLIFVLVCP